ncbi:MAG: hypothetical protein LBV72_00145 [Tannerella sp.]|jgi:hypothetical protein|nr:hypothetical protein [Tannerella sp.]
MEDNIGNLIYYILIFAVALISWISGLTKKKQQKQTTIPAPFPTQEITDVPPAPPKKRKQGPPPVPKRMRQESYKDSFLSSKNKDATTILQEEEGTHLMDDLELNNPESFRKAIIYSEILNRKEW